MRRPRVPSLHLLTDYQANSLRAAGITSVCYGTGLQRASIPATATPDGSATTVAVVTAHDGTDPWNDDEGSEMTFDGLSITQWMTGASGVTPSWDSANGAGEIVVLWIAPTTDWTASPASANNDWTKGAVEMGIDIQGQCPIPAEDTQATAGEASFAYYMAYFKVYNNGAAARLIGTTCPRVRRDEP